MRFVSLFVMIVSACFAGCLPERDDDEVLNALYNASNLRRGADVTLLLVDAGTGELVPNASVLVAGGEPVEAKTGVARFSVSDVSEKNPVVLALGVRADGYIGSGAEISLHRAGETYRTIGLVNPDSPPPGVSVFRHTSGTAENGKLLSDLQVATPGNSAVFRLFAGTVLTDEHGGFLDGSLDATVAYFDNQTDDSLTSFPGGLDVEGGVFVSGGFAEIEVRDAAGRPAKNLSAGAELEIGIPEATVHPKTGGPVSAGDTIPVWSFDWESGWSPEGEETVGTGGRVRHTLRHLSFWNLDWKEKSCSRSGIVRIGGNQDVPHRTRAAHTTS